VERLHGHRDAVYSLAFTRDEGLVSGSLDETLKYWNISSPIAGRLEGEKEDVGVGAAKGVNGPGVNDSQCTMNFIGHKDYVISVAISHDGQWIVSGSKDHGVRFWDAETAIEHCMLQGHRNAVLSVDLSPAGDVLATGSGDWQVRIWNYNTI